MTTYVHRDALIRQLWQHALMARAAYRADTHRPDPCGRFKATHLDLCDGCRILRDAANNRAKVAAHKQRKASK